MKRLSIIFTILIMTILVNTPNAIADTPPPPPGGGHGQGGNAPPGGGSPIGEGILILGVLASGYAVRKWTAHQNFNRAS